MQIYAVAIMASRYVPNGIETSLNVATFACENEREAKRVIAEHIVVMFPFDKGFHSHRTNYCTVKQEAIDAYLQANNEDI